MRCRTGINNNVRDNRKMARIGGQNEAGLLVYNALKAHVRPISAMRQKRTTL